MHYAFIKVCGMRQAVNIKEVEALGIDWMGLIFWAKSSRYVSTPPAYLPAKAKRVGVFVDADMSDIVQHISDYRLDAIQLHGHESRDFAAQLRGKTTVIKAISVSSRDDIARWKDYEDVADYLLFDTKCKTVGGSGEHFDWQVLQDYDGPVPFLLSGGIGPDDAERLRAFSHPCCAGIDLNSRFESSPGIKDTEKLEKFIKEIR